MFLGMVVLIIAALILEPLGFVVTAALLLFAYGMLLGEQKWWRLAIISCLLGVILHIAFSGLLGVNLPRGTVSFLRDFSLFLENLF
jgi:putative tricarboxylic transport membrane protein